MKEKLLLVKPTRNSSTENFGKLSGKLTLANEKKSTFPFPPTPLPLRFLIINFWSSDEPFGLQVKKIYHILSSQL